MGRVEELTIRTLYTAELEEVENFVTTTNAENVELKAELEKSETKFVEYKKKHEVASKNIIAIVKKRKDEEIDILKNEKDNDIKKLETKINELKRSKPQVDNTKKLNALVKEHEKVKHELDNTKSLLEEALVTSEDEKETHTKKTKEFDGKIKVSEKRRKDPVHGR